MVARGRGRRGGLLLGSSSTWTIQVPVWLLPPPWTRAGPPACLVSSIHDVSSSNRPASPNRRGADAEDGTYPGTAGGPRGDSVISRDARWRSTPRDALDRAPAASRRHRTRGTARAKFRAAGRSVFENRCWSREVERRVGPTPPPPPAGGPTPATRNASSRRCLATRSCAGAAVTGTVNGETARSGRSGHQRAAATLFSPESRARNYPASARAKVRTVRVARPARGQVRLVVWPCSRSPDEAGMKNGCRACGHRRLRVVFRRSGRMLEGRRRRPAPPPPWFLVVSVTAIGRPGPPAPDRGAAV
jgi:hypothetical protein